LASALASEPVSGSELAPVEELGLGAKLVFVKVPVLGLVQALVLAFGAAPELGLALGLALESTSELTLAMAAERVSG
jgi:hypothetical protein